jgi:hypothetical protein
VADPPTSARAVDIVELDDVIPLAYQDQIEAEVRSDRMAWFFSEESGRRVSGVEANYAGFSHLVYHIDGGVSAPSSMTALLLPLLYIFCDRARLPFNTLLRIRLGLFPRTMIDVPHHNPHVDFYQPHQSAIYYVNDSDGDTVIFNETSDQVSLEQSLRYTKEDRFTVAARVSPKKGRMCGFDGRYYHASMHPRQNSSRFAIAFSFL